MVPTSAPSPPASPSPEAGLQSMGTPVEVSPGIRITINSAGEEVQEGRRFVVVNLTVENASQTVLNGGDILALRIWTLLVWDDAENIYVAHGCPGEGHPSFYEQIDSLSPGVNKKWPPGLAMTGDLCYEVPTDSKGFQLRSELWPEGEYVWNLGF